MKVNLTMRIEKVVSNLLDLSKQKDVTPDRLARICILTLKKVADSSPSGGEALKLVQSRFLREALSTDLNIKRLRRKGARRSSAVATVARKATPRKSVVKETA